MKGEKDGKYYDLDTRCFSCNCFAYCACYRGEWTLSGFICDTCIGAIDMRPGRMRTQIVIEQKVAGSPQQTASGEPDVAWTTYATVMAQIQPIIGREFYAADAVQSKVTTKIRIRYLVGYTDGITAAMRINASGVVYNIEAVADVNNMHDELLLYCSTGANDG